MTHKEDCDIAYKWLLNRCGFAFNELSAATSWGEIPDAIGFKGWGESTLVEVKTSRADFLRDKKKIFRIHPERGMGTFRFYLCPKDLIKIEDLPDNWGLIYVNEKGKARIKHNPYNTKGGNHWRGGFTEKCRKSETQMMYSALRRLHIRKRIDEIYLPIGKVL